MMKQKKIKEFETEINNILVQFKKDPAVQNGIVHFNDLIELSSIRRLFRSKNRSVFTLLKYLFYLSSVWILLNNGHNIMRFYRSYSQSKCLIPLPDILQNAFVPANECNFCLNLTRIDRVHSITPEIFSKR